MTSSTQNETPIFQHLERKFTAAPTLKLSSVLRTAAVGLPTLTEALEARDHALGMATLPSQTLLKLLSLYQQHVSRDLAASVLWHRPSLSAREKTTILPGYLIQKTLTLQLGGDLVMVSGVGDFKVDRPLIQQIIRALDLKKRVQKLVHINPREYPSESLYGILTGMVSPFLEPARSTTVQAVVFLKHLEIGGDWDKLVAISVSPFESLLVPIASFHTLLYAYAGATYLDRWREIAVEPGGRTVAEREVVLVCP